MNLIAFFSKPVKLEVGEHIRYKGQNGQIFWGKIEKIDDNLAKVRCFVMGSEMIQWIALSKIRKPTRLETLNRLSNGAD